MARDFYVSISLLLKDHTKPSYTDSGVVSAGSPRVAAQKSIHNHPSWGLSYRRQDRQLDPGDKLIIEVTEKGR